MRQNVKRPAKRCEVKARVLHHVLTSYSCRVVDLLKMMAEMQDTRHKVI